MKVYFLTKERTLITKNMTSNTRWISFENSIYRIDNSAVGISKKDGKLQQNAEIVFSEANPFPLFTTEVDVAKIGDILSTVVIENVLHQTVGEKGGFGFKDITGFFSDLSMKKFMPFLAIPIAIYVIYVVISTLIGGGRLF